MVKKRYVFGYAIEYELILYWNYYIDENECLV